MLVIRRMQLSTMINSGLKLRKHLRTPPTYIHRCTKSYSKLAKLHLQQRPETNKHIRYTFIITSTQSQKHLVIHITEQTDIYFLTFSKHLPQTGTGRQITLTCICYYIALHWCTVNAKHCLSQVIFRKTLYVTDNFCLSVCCNDKQLLFKICFIFNGVS